MSAEGGAFQDPRKWGSPIPYDEFDMTSVEQRTSQVRRGFPAGVAAIPQRFEWCASLALLSTLPVQLRLSNSRLA